jgi:serine/threonine-protein kinase
MGESNAEQALQLLSSQPEEIQQQPRVRELRAKLDASNERGRLIDEAIRNADEALKQHDLRSGLAGLEAAKRAHGDSPRLASAITEYKTGRVKIANELVTAAIESATQSIQQNNRPAAAEALAGVADAAEFADSGLQASLKRLTKEAGKPPAKAPVKAAAAPAQAKSGSSHGLLIAVVVILLLGAAGAAYWYKYLRPAPTPAMGVLELNAVPYAEVLSVTSDRGKAIPLPAGDHWTPLRLEGILDGRYAVSFKGADGTTKTQQCYVDQSEQVCEIEIKPIDNQAIEQIIGGEK